MQVSDTCPSILRTLTRIELVFHPLKTCLRKAAQRTIEGLNRYVGSYIRTARRSRRWRRVPEWGSCRYGCRPARNSARRRKSRPRHCRGCRSGGHRRLRPATSRSALITSAAWLDSSRPPRESASRSCRCISAARNASAHVSSLPGRRRSISGRS